MTKLDTIIQITKGFEGGICLHDPIVVDLIAGSFYCFALRVVGEDLWLMDQQGEWQGSLQEDQFNADKVINAIYNKVKRLLREAA